MMKAIKHIPLAALAAAAGILSGGCTQDNDTPAHATRVAPRITAVIESTPTRASGTAWDAGDAIGIHVENTDGQIPFENVKYVTTQGDGTFTVANGEGGIYYPGNATVYFWAYYPYEGENGVLPGREGIISRTITAADQTPGGQAKIDYLFAEAIDNEENPDLQLRFRHCMSRIRLEFLPGDNEGPFDDGLTYTIGALGLEGTFDTRTESRTTVTGTGSLTMTVDYHASGMTSTLIVFPQQANSVNIEITAGGRNYTGTLEYPENPDNGNTRELLPGHSYAYSIKMEKSVLTTTPATIAPWEKGNGDNGEDVPAWN